MERSLLESWFLSVVCLRGQFFSLQSWSLTEVLHHNQGGSFSFLVFVPLSVFISGFYGVFPLASWFLTAVLPCGLERFSFKVLVPFSF